MPLALVLLLAACSSLAPSRPAGADPVLVVQPDAPADAVLVTIGDAIANAGGAAFVGGMLLIDADGTPWLCDALGESFPPTCSGDRVRIENLAAVALPKLTTGGGARWSEGPIQLLGTVRVS
jgi:hypothetical protein